MWGTLIWEHLIGYNFSQFPLPVWPSVLSLLRGDTVRTMFQCSYSCSPGCCRAEQLSMKTLIERFPLHLITANWFPFRGYFDKVKVETFLNENYYYYVFSLKNISFRWIFDRFNLHRTECFSHHFCINKIKNKTIYGRWLFCSQIVPLISRRFDFTDLFNSNRRADNTFIKNTAPTTEKVMMRNKNDTLKVCGSAANFVQKQRIFIHISAASPVKTISFPRRLLAAGGWSLVASSPICCKNRI